MQKEHYEPKLDKRKVLKKLNSGENNFSKAEMEISNLGKFIQLFFEEEIVVCMSTDGAVIINSNGEIGFVRNFINEI